MKDFRLFDITDFVMDEDFIRWVYDKKPEDEAFWNDWLHRYPDKHLVVAEARRILESVNMVREPVSDHLVQQEVSRLLQTIGTQPLRAQETAAPRISARKWWYVAGGVLLLVTAGAYYRYFSPAGTIATPVREQPFAYARITAGRRLVENVNTSGRALRISLPDSSVIELAPDSRIAYANGFDTVASRDVYLSGEAFFKVAKDPARPFRVFANDIVTKVLGTSFIVRSFDKDTTIQVTVRTGKVSVYAQAAKALAATVAPTTAGEVILTPNQQLVYGKAARTFQKTLLENPVLIAPGAQEDKLTYEDAPLNEVFSELGKAYDINIVYDEELLKHCTVTADLKNESFYNKLDLICRAVGARYEVIEGQVVIQAGGCK